MIKLCKERLDQNKDNLKRGIELYYKHNKIHSYKDLFKIICIYLHLGNIDDIREINTNCTHHVMFITSIGRNIHHDNYIMTYIYYNYEDEPEEYEFLDCLIDEDNSNDYDIISKLMEICITMINNIINPYCNTGDFEKIEI